MQTGRVLAFILVICLLFAGCLQVPDKDPTDPPADGSGQDDLDDGSDPGDDNTDADGPAPGDGGDDDEDDPDDEGSDRACHEKEKTNDRYPPAPPNEQEVDTIDEIVCPGHFVVTDEGSGKGWNVPSWEPDDWWSYQRDQINQSSGYACHQRFHETVNGTGEFWEVPVYRLDVEWYDCNGNQEREHAQNRTQGSLSEFSDHRWGENKEHGYINHFILFPLKDGKKWTFMNAAGRLVDSEVSHRPNHLFDGQIVEAWQVDSEIENVALTHWYGVEERNLLREERMMHGIMFDYTVLVDSGSRE